MAEETAGSGQQLVQRWLPAASGSPRGTRRWWRQTAPDDWRGTPFGLDGGDRSRSSSLACRREARRHASSVARTS